MHIPFCFKKCLYCDFNSYHGKEHLFEAYVETLKAEIRRASDRYPDIYISTIFFGGGTPTLLSFKQLISILDEIRTHFHMDSHAEITTEANPGTVSRESLHILHDAGFNRLGLGIQSLNDHELALLGRIHSSEEAIKAFDSAREAGFRNISVDLMYGIPGQTPKTWRRTLEGILNLQPEHVSLYSLTIEEGTPFHAMQVEGALSLPGEDIEADMYEEAIRILTGTGFSHYEISNFSRPGFECRHNITYWQNEPYLGLGAGASSYIEGIRSTNISAIEEYIDNVRSNKSVAGMEEKLQGHAAMGETVFLGLRMLEGLDMNRFTERYGISPEYAFPEQISNLLDGKLIEKTGSHIRLTHKGLLFANEVFAEFVNCV